eukprot:1458526-Pleurochrysis_carterae.AAC.1
MVGALSSFRPRPLTTSAHTRICCPRAPLSYERAQVSALRRQLDEQRTLSERAAQSVCEGEARAQRETQLEIEILELRGELEAANALLTKLEAERDSAVAIALDRQSAKHAKQMASQQRLLEETEAKLAETAAELQHVQVGEEKPETLRHIHTHAHARGRSSAARANTHTHARTHTSTHARAYAQAYAHTHTPARAHARILMHAHKRRCMHMCIHYMCIHAHEDG